MNLITEHAVPNALKLQDLQAGTLTNPVLKRVIEYIGSNKWYEIEKQAQDGETNKLLKRFCKIKDSITLIAEKNLILKDNRIVLPIKYHTRASQRQRPYWHVRTLYWQLRWMVTF